MPKTDIQKYEPMIVVELKNGRKLLTLASHRKAIEARWNSKEINYVENITVAHWMISTIEPLPAEYDVLIALPEDLRNRVEARFKEYFTNLGKKPDRKAKLQIIKKITQQYSPG
jgi:hypothetical protein